MKNKVYNQQGKETGTIELPENVFGVRWNPDLVHQVAVSLAANARTRVAHTKDRSEVSGGGRKPWRQKGTGRARHGSRRSPLWRTGGVTFGPRNERDFSKKINKKMKTKALYTVLSDKLRGGELLFLDALHFNEIKTKMAKEVINNLGAISGFEKLPFKKRNAAFIAFAQKNPVAEKSFRNFGNIEIDESRNMNAGDLLKYKYVVIVNPEQSIKILEKQRTK